MDDGFGQMQVSGLAGQIGNLENRLLEEIMTTLSFGGERTVEFGIMFKNLLTEEFYVNMTLQINLFTFTCLCLTYIIRIIIKSNFIVQEFILIPSSRL